MDEKKYIGSVELRTLFGLKAYQLSYLVENGLIPVVRRGSGIKRLFPRRKAIWVLEQRGHERRNRE